MRHVVNPTANHEQAGASKCKGDGDRGDHIVTPFKVGVLAQLLEILLLLNKLLTWKKWLFRQHPGWPGRVGRDAMGWPAAAGGGSGGWE